MSALQDVGSQVVDIARRLGADEISVMVNRSVSSELSQRAGVLEKCQHSQSLSVQVDLLVSERFSSHATSDLRPEALEGFLVRAVNATRYLEPDANRRLPEASLMASANPATLDVDDPTQPSTTPVFRREQLGELEAAILDRGTDCPMRSTTAWVWDGRVESQMICSNGFDASWSRTSNGRGGELTMEDEGGRLPEAYSFYSARHRTDLPSTAAVADDLLSRAMRRMGSSAAPSGRYPMLLENRCVPRILQVLLGPLSGRAIYEGRSCLREKLNTRIAPEGFNLLDDPLIPRALASRPHDGDGLVAKRRAIVKDGVLQSFYLDVYNARRLDTSPTSGSSSNIVIPTGTRSPEEILRGIPEAIRVEGFLGGNTNALTGDFSFGINGTRFVNGEPAQAVSEMNISGNLFTLLDQWRESATDAWLFGSQRAPSMLFDQIQFSGS